MGQLSIKRQIMPILYGFLAVNLFSIVPVRLYTFCVTLQNTLMRDLASQFAGEQTVGGNIIQIASNALSLLRQTPNLLNLLFMIALGYCVVKIFFDNIKRGGILDNANRGRESVYVLDSEGYTDGFISWCKQVIALCLTAFLQVTLPSFLGLLTWQNNILLGLGVMLAADEVPSRNRPEFRTRHQHQSQHHERGAYDDNGNQSLKSYCERMSMNEYIYPTESEISGETLALESARRGGHRCGDGDISVLATGTTETVSSDWL